MKRFSRLQKIILSGVLFITLFFIIMLLSPHNATAPIDADHQNASKALSTATIYIKDKVVTVSIADTIETMTLGLGKRDSLSPNEGMWFVFGSKSQWGIWMKDMKFPIDIIWVDENLKMVSIAEKISPDTYPKVFYPSQDAQYVLEVNAGFVENSGVEVGNTLLVR